MTWTPKGAGSYIKFTGAADLEKANLVDSAKSGTPTFASGDVTVPIDTGETITNLFRNTTAATFYDGDVTAIDAVDTAGIQGGDYLQGDDVNLACRFDEIIIAIGETVEIDWIREPVKTMLLDGTSSGNRMRFEFEADGSEAVMGSTFTYTVNGGAPVANLPVDEVSSFVLTATATAGLTRMFETRTLAHRGGGLVGNLVVTQAAGTTIYRMDNVVDNGDGTGTVPNTGTNVGQGDMTIYNFVAATDVVTVPNNTFSYDLSEGSGSTLGSTPSGKDITLVNNPTWS